MCNLCLVVVHSTQKNVFDCLIKKTNAYHYLPALKFYDIINGKDRDKDYFYPPP